MNSFHQPFFPLFLFFFLAEHRFNFVLLMRWDRVPNISVNISMFLQGFRVKVHRDANINLHDNFIIIFQLKGKIIVNQKCRYESILVCGQEII